VEAALSLIGNRLPGAPADLGSAGELIRAFLEPPWQRLAAGEAFSDAWSPGGPWRAGARLPEAAS